MYLARVAVGSFVKGNSNMKEAPPRPAAGPGILYDSVVNDVATPSIFVVFHDAAAYPEHVITFQ